MAQGLYIDTTALGKRAEQFEALLIRFPRQVDDILNGHALEIVASAKRMAPADRGQIRQGISAITAEPLKKTITSQAPYSAYMEFGTGKAAATYISSLPETYKAYAATFKGSGNGDSFVTFVFRIAEWIRRKGIGVTYTTGIVKKKGGGHTLDLNRATPRKKNLTGDALLNLAYVIAKSIYINGVHPHPFMIPSLINQEPKMKRDLIKYLNYLKL